MSEQRIGELLGTITADVFLYSGSLDEALVDSLLNAVDENPIAERSNRNATLFLTTNGGSPHAAFRLSRCLGTYGGVRVIIAGRCKSAGTLAAIGGTELAMGLWGELGPLDVQMDRPDELIVRSSGLDILGAWAAIQSRGFSAFSQYLVELTRAGLSTKLSAEIAASLASGLLQPVSAQIDPVRLAEAERSIEVATEYGERLKGSNLKPEGLETLVNGYPTHGFVIDKSEAEKLFVKVDDLTAVEVEIATLIETEYGIIRYPPPPSRAGLALDLKAAFPEKPEGGNDGTGTADPKAGESEPEDREGSPSGDGEAAPTASAVTRSNGSEGSSAG